MFISVKSITCQSQCSRQHSEIHWICSSGQNTTLIPFNLSQEKNHLLWHFGSHREASSDCDLYLVMSRDLDSLQLDCPHPSPQHTQPPPPPTPTHTRSRFMACGERLILIVSLFLRVSEENILGVVYEIPCNNCGFKYIGETGRNSNRHWVNIRKMPKMYYREQML